LFLLLLQDPLNEGTTRFLMTDVDDDGYSAPAETALLE
jgi:hypothetical protein